MIELSKLVEYETTTDRDDSHGWHFGVCHLQVKLTTGYVNFWWCSCRHCASVAVMSHAELRSDKRECMGCGYNLFARADAEFDWGADRRMRAWEVNQAELSTAYRLGGADAVQVLATELLEQLRADEQRIKARSEAIKSTWQP